MLHNAQQQWYSTPILNNVTMHTYQTCVIHGCDLIISEKDKVGVLDNKLNNFYNLIWYVLLISHQPNYAYHWFTFIQ